MTLTDESTAALFGLIIGFLVLATIGVWGGF